MYILRIKENVIKVFSVLKNINILKSIIKSALKCHSFFVANIFNNNCNSILFTKKLLSLTISYSLIYSQIAFSFILTQSVISVVSTRSAYADAIATAPENIEHNPINYIEVDNTIGINNGDTNGNGNNAYLDRAQNGTPLVNINNATAGGVSANYYKDFNVTDENLILNNYKGESVNTNLGGVVYGNPNFNGSNGREADIILNEITTNRVSNIEGYIEVAGRKADVIIANPNGIMVSGGGFINTSRLSLITGKSGACSDGTTNCGTLDSNGNLNPFLLTDTGTNPNAIITVVGRNVYDANGNAIAYNLGIDATNVNYVDLISRIVKINGNIIGNTDTTKGYTTEVSFKTGNDKAYYNRDANGNSNTNGFNVVSKTTADTESTKPEFAIDSTAFGGVQAGRINFIATENGVGVRSRSDLIASVNDINFDVNGNIDLEETGSVYAKNNVNLNNTVNTINNPNKETDNSSSDYGNTPNNRHITNKSYIVAENDVNVGTNNLNNTNISSTETTVNQQTREITTTAKSANTQTSLIYAMNDITLNADELDNSNTIDSNNTRGIIANDGTIYLNIAKLLNNESGNILGNNVNINFTNTNDFATTTTTLSTDVITGLPTSTSITTYTLTNTSGNIISTSDIIINLLTDYIITGTIYSSGGSVDITAKDITNYSDVLAGNDITFNATGNIRNGSSTNTTASIIAMNNLIFNIMRDTTDGTDPTTSTLYANSGNLYNYGKITSYNNLTINAENSVYNGMNSGSSALISGLNSVVIIANTKLINRGYIQSANGTVSITTNGEINSDYDLGGSNTGLSDIKNATEVSTEVQAKLDNINNIADLTELTTLLTEIKTEEQYNKVQNRIRVLNIKDLISNLQTAYIFNSDDWTLGNTITITTIDASTGAETTSDVVLTETVLQSQLKELLGDNYDTTQWSITADLTAATTTIDTNIQAQQNRLTTYNDEQEQTALNTYNTNKEQARQDYITANGNDTGFTYNTFTWIDYTLQQYVDTNPTLEANGVLDRNTLIQQAETQIKQERLNDIQTTINTEKAKADIAATVDWTTLQNTEVQTNLQTLLSNNYDAEEWSINSYEDTNVASAITIAYLSGLRVNSIDTSKTEQTGIHNYGRIYSGTDMTLNSNSVLHNNSGALIYSNHNINFNVNNVLFNNEDAIGQGIYSAHDINIKGYRSSSSTSIFDTNGNLNSNWGAGSNTDSSTGTSYYLKKLFNYNARIEAENDINITAKDTVNYGSDSIDLSKINNEIQAKYKYYKYGNGLRKKIEISEATYNSLLSSGATGLSKVFQYYYIESSPELASAYYLETKDTGAYPGLYQTVLKYYQIAHSLVTSNSSTIQSNSGDINIDGDNVTNYNSLIYAGGNIDMDVDNLLNKFLQLNVNARNTYWYHGKDCDGWGSCDEYIDGWSSSVIIQTTGNQSAMIVAKGNVDIAAKQIGNGTVDDYSSYSPTTTRIPYSPETSTTTVIDDILSSGTLNPLNSITLPTGNYGVFRKSDDPNSNYLYETDPTLVDINSFLGSQYFMNRIGLDPYTIDVRFLGDAYFEYTMLKQSILEAGLYQNTYSNSTEIADKITAMYNALDNQKATELGLTFGTALTEEQRSKLTTDIIWYVKQSVDLGNGEIVEVLVPQIFYCDATLKQIEENRISNTVYSMIAGNSVTLTNQHSEGIINNSGIIAAKNNLIITGFDTVNNITTSIDRSSTTTNTNGVATLSAGNILYIDTTSTDSTTGETTTGTVNNLSGTISVGSADNTDSLLYINTGTLNNSTITQQDTVGSNLIAGNNLIINTATDLNNTGNSIIVARNNLSIAAGNNISNTNGALIRNLNSTYTTTDTSTGETITNNATFQLLAGNNINNIGSQIQANTSGTAIVYAENNINNETTKIRVNQPGGYKDVIRDEAGISNSGTGGSLLIQANTGDITNTGADISADGTVQLVAGNDITFKTLELESYSKISGKHTTTEIQTLTNIGSDIISENGNIVMQAGNDIHLTSVDVNAKNDIYLATTNGDTILDTAVDTYEKTSTYNKKGSFGRKTSITTNTTTNTNVLNNLNAENGSIIMASGDNINIAGSKLSAEEDISLNAVNDITLASVLDTTSHSSQMSKKGTVSSKQSTDIYKTGTNQITELNSNNVIVNANTGDLTSYGTEFNALNTNGDTTGTNGNINLSAGDDVNLYNVKDYTYDYSYYQSSKMDLGTVIVSTIGGTLTGGPVGMILGAYNGLSARVGKTDMTEDYNETVIGNILNAANNINITSGTTGTANEGDITLISTILNAGNNTTLTSGNDVLIGTAIENDYHNEYHKEQKRDLLGAFASNAVQGAIGAATGQVNTYTQLYLESEGTFKDANINTVINETRHSSNTNISTDITTANNLNMTSQSNMTLIASNLNVGNNATLESKEGSISLLNATDTVTDYTRHYEKSFDGVFVDGFDNILDPAKNLARGDVQGYYDSSFENVKNFGVSAGVQFDQNEQITNTTTNTSVGNSINAKNNVNITANSTKDTDNTGNIVQIGSDVYSEQGNINYTANNGDILMSSGTNSTLTTSSYDDTTITTGVKIGNAYADVVGATDNLVKAGEAIKSAYDELKRMKDLKSEGKASSAAVEDAEVNLALAQVNYLAAELAVAASVAGAASAAATSFGTGFYASAFTNYDTTSTKTTEQSTWQTQNNIVANGGNVNFTTTATTDSDGNTLNGDMSQEGTNVYASNTDGTGTINYNIANDLTVEASKDTYAYRSSTDNENAGVSVGNNAVQVSYGQSNASSRVTSSTYDNSDVYANIINITTGNNATFTGANINATEGDNGNGGDINMNIGNNLTVESLQDTYYAKNNSNSFNIGVGIGTQGMGNFMGGSKDNTGNNSVSVGFSTNKSTTDSSWVNDQTEIIGSNSVNINVGTKQEIKDANGNIIQAAGEGKTDILGAIITSGSYETTTNADGTQTTKFNDNGNLQLATKELTYENLEDFYKTESTGFGFSTTIGKSNTDQGKSAIAPEGSTTISMTDTGSEKDQSTKATIGNGNIVIGGNSNSDLEGLNRDVNNSQEITKDMITGALDSTVTIDNRIFSSKGIDSIADNLENFGRNLKTVYKDITENNIIVQSIKTALDDKNDLNVIDAAKQYVSDTGKQQKIQINEDLLKKINGETNLTPEQVKDSLNQVAEIMNENGDTFKDLKISDVNGNIVGLSYVDSSGNTQTVNINLSNVDISKPDQIISIIAHETTNIASHNSNDNNATARASMNEAIWDMLNYANKNTNSINGSDWLVVNSGSSVIQSGNSSLVSSLYNASQGNGSVDFDVYKISKDLEISPFGKHTLIVTDPNRLEDFTEEKMKEQGIDTSKVSFITLDNGKKVISISGQATSMKNGNLIADFNNEYDLKAINEYYNVGTENDKTKWYKKDYDTGAELIKSNSSDTEFIYSILKNAQNYKENTENILTSNNNATKTMDFSYNQIDYGLLPTNNDSGYNCNSFSNSLLNNSGATNSNIYTDIEGLDAGKYKKIDSKYFIQNGVNMNFINPLINNR